MACHGRLGLVCANKRRPWKASVLVGDPVRSLQARSVEGTAENLPTSAGAGRPVLLSQRMFRLVHVGTDALNVGDPRTGKAPGRSLLMTTHRSMPRICLGIFIVALFVTVPLRAGSPANAAWPAANNPAICPSSMEGSVPPGDLASSLRSDLEDGELHEFTLFQAALVAGGLQSRIELQRRTDQFNELRSSLAHELKSNVDRQSKLDLTLRRLHEWLLTGEYRAEFSELHRTLDLGHYNCVTATILFQALGDGCGLETRAIAAQSHVLCGLPGQPALYVETTCRDWQSAEFEACPRRTQELVQEGRELSPVQLLSKVYYNLGVAQLEDNCFAEAAERLKMARQLDCQDLAARTNLLATYNNWALAECDARRFRAASELLLCGLTIDSQYGPLLANDLHIHQQWIRQLCDAGDFATAVELLVQGYRRRPNSELFDRGRIAVYELWAQHHFVLGDLPAGWGVLTEAQRRCGTASDTTREIAVIEAACEVLLSRHQPAVATRLLQQALERHPDHPDMLRRKYDLLQTGL